MTNRALTLTILTVTLAALTSGFTPAHARGSKGGGYTYDYGSGNTYSSSGNSYRGNNLNTGSNWSASTRGATTTGTDSRGNGWTYNSNSGVYMNYGTGETRYRGAR